MQGTAIRVTAECHAGVVLAACKRRLPTLWVIVVILGWPTGARADLWTWNRRLDHALWPEHDQKLVVSGEITSISSKREFRFHISDVILGAPSHKGQFVTVQTAIMWPETLTPYRQGAYCILVLGTSRNRPGSHYLSAVVPGRRRPYQRASDTISARAVLAEELLSQLKREESNRRKRLLLLQLAPVLVNENSEALVPMLSSDDEWVRRGATAALVYATEDPKYIKAAAEDIQEYLRMHRGAAEVDGIDRAGRELRANPDKFLFEYYFFLVPRTWTWGSMWNEQEAEKHLRIRNGMLELGILDDASKKQLLGQ